MYEDVDIDNFAYRTLAAFDCLKRRGIAFCVVRVLFFTSNGESRNKIPTSYIESVNSYTVATMHIEPSIN